MIVLKLDGEIWYCEEGWDTDKNSVGNVRPINPRSTIQSDINALAKGITHRQGMYGGIPCHEVEKVGEVGDGKTYKYPYIN